MPLPGPNARPLVGPDPPRIPVEPPPVPAVAVPRVGVG